MPAPIDLTGLRFGMWTVLRLGQKQGPNRRWLCRCDCGTEGLVTTKNLRSGASTNCGCVRVESVRAMGMANRKYKEGYRRTPNGHRRLLCPTCGQTFTATGTRSRYCSRPCCLLAKKASKLCAMCGAVVPPGHRRYCSKSCKHIAAHRRANGRTFGRFINETERLVDGEHRAGDADGR